MHIQCMYLVMRVGKFVSLLCWLNKLNAVSTPQYKSKQTLFPWCLMPIGTIQQSDSLNTQSTVLTYSSVSVASVVNGKWRWQPQHNLLNSVFITFMSACVIESRSTGSCSSRGLCAGRLITGLSFELLLTTSLWRRMPVKGYQYSFQEPVL